MIVDNQNITSNNFKFKTNMDKTVKAQRAMEQSMLILKDKKKIRQETKVKDADQHGATLK